MTDDSTTGGPQSAAANAVDRARMPLGARRLILIGSLGILAGVLAGRYYFGGLILASAGITLLAMALSYQAGKPWFSRLTWLVAAAGTLWTTTTAWYWWLMDAAANEASGPVENASLAINLGAGALLVMLAGMLTAVITRWNRRRQNG